MASRRLVNLAMTDNRNRMFSIHRMDLSKLLFYPSTAEAEAAAGAKGKPPKMGRQLRLPPPIMGFEPFPTTSSVQELWDSMFVLLHDPRGRSSEASRILFSNSAGQAAMYDVESRSVISVPDLRRPEPMGYTHSTPIVTGAGAGKEALYMMHLHSCSEFKVLDFNHGGKSRDSFPMNKSSRSLLWQSLPPLPFERATFISSSTVVDMDRIICVSAGRYYCNYGQGQSGTFCFDTESQEWWQVGDWLLPFHGRAEYVPELDTWLGFSRDHPHHLCAVDLSGVAMAPRQAPTLQHVWEDYNPPPTEEESLVLNKDYPNIVLTRRAYWKVNDRFLINLGGGRFCVAKVLEGEESVSLSWSYDSRDAPNGELTVLTGVEVIRDGGDGGELRIVKHKSRELVHTGLYVACVL